MRISDWSSDVCSSDLFFVDTADTAEIRDLAESGLVDGVTTNPSLIHKSGRKFLEVVAEICSITSGPVSAEVVALDHETMMKEADILRKIADNVAIKVPLTIDGLKTCKALTDDGTMRSEEHTYELQSLMRSSYAVF